MLGEVVAEKAGQAVIEDVCCRARKNGCNLLEQPREKLENALKVMLSGYCILKLQSKLHPDQDYQFDLDRNGVGASSSMCGVFNLCCIASQAAFERAHQASLCVYDDPPSCITYPYNNR